MKLIRERMILRLCWITKCFSGTRIEKSFLFLWVHTHQVSLHSRDIHGMTEATPASNFINECPISPLQHHCFRAREGKELALVLNRGTLFEWNLSAWGRHLPTRTEAVDVCDTLIGPSLQKPKPLLLSWRHEVWCGQRKRARREESKQVPGRDYGRRGGQLTQVSSGACAPS